MYKLVAKVLNLWWEDGNLQSVRCVLKYQNVYRKIFIPLAKCTHVFVSKARFYLGHFDNVFREADGGIQFQCYCAQVL